MVDAAAGVGLEVSVQSKSGYCSGQVCEVTVVGKKVELSLSYKVCTGELALRPCEEKPTDLHLYSCKIPALAEGTYQIDFGSLQNRTIPLTVSAKGTRTSCSIEKDAVVSLEGLPTACEADDDCVTVSGNACNICSCGGEGIAKAGLAEYEARVAEQKTKCAQGTTGPVCGGCVVAKARCVDKKCTTKG